MTYWTPEQDARLLELRAQGMSFGAIGALIGKTKNAVISRARRRSVNERVGYCKPAKAAKPEPAQKPWPVKMPEIKTPKARQTTYHRAKAKPPAIDTYKERLRERERERVLRRLEILGLPKDADLYLVSHGHFVAPRKHPIDVTAPMPSCQWIDGDPADGHCGKPSAPGRSYCKEHAARCYTRAKVAA